MRRLKAAAILAAASTVGIATAVRRHRAQRNHDNMLRSFARELTANAARQVTNQEERSALARAALELHGAGLTSEIILALMPASGPLTGNLDALMRFMGQPVLIAREHYKGDVTALRRDNPEGFARLCEAIGNSSIFLESCVWAAPMLINLPTPLKVPGDTLVALDNLNVQIRTRRTWMV